MKMSVCSLACQQSVFQRDHSEKHLSKCYPQDGGESQLASKLRHCHHVYCVLRRVCCGARLPFVEATILEILRYKTVVPLAMLHRALKDTEVGGFFIPEGTAVSLMLICGDAALAVDVKTFEKNV